MKISIIIPVYNVELYIERCISSALNQTYQNIEIILIDDCGQDNSMVIAQQIIENHPNRFKAHILKHEKNRGVSEARNSGIRAANGSYLFFLDSDDEMPNDSLQSLVSNCHNDDMVMGSYSTVFGKRSYETTRTIYSCEDDIKCAFFKRLFIPMSWNRLIRKEFVLDNNLFFIPGLLHEDVAWHYFSAMAAKKITTIQAITYIYRMRDDSICSNIKLKNCEDLHRTFYIIHEDIIKRNIHKKKEVLRFLACFAVENKVTSVILGNIKYVYFYRLKYKIKDIHFFIDKNILFMYLPIWLQYIFLRCKTFRNSKKIITNNKGLSVENNDKR
jgi:glycosyltransferase involved in cell wall biosynthesis